MKKLIPLLLIAGLLVGLTVTPVFAGGGPAFECPYDPSGTELQSYSHILTQPVVSTTWHTLTKDYVKYPLEQTMVKARISPFSGNPNLQWYDSRGKWLGFQFVAPTPDGLWDIHYNFTFHPNLTLAANATFRMAACGQYEHVFLRQGKSGWEIGIPKWQ